VAMLSRRDRSDHNRGTLLGVQDVRV
jgi:hypothetical protein